MMILKHRYTMSTLLYFLLGLTISYWVAYFFVPVDWLNDVLDGSLIALASIVTVKYTTWTMFNFRTTTDRALMVRVGIAGSWFVTFMWRISRFLYAEKAFGPAVIGVHDSWRGYCIALACAFASMHILAIGMENGYPRRYYVNLCMGAAILGAVTISAIKLIPH